MTQKDSRTSARAALAAALAVGVVLTACDADIFEPQWASNIDTVELFTLARPELNLPSAFSFSERRTVRVEAATSTGSWDIALDTRGGELVFVPPPALGIASRARISLRSGVTFEEVEEAPTDTTEYSGDAPVPAQVGTVYIVRTGQGANLFGRSCVYFAKFEALELDEDVGTVRFLYEANPICNDPRLVPTTQDGPD